MTINNKNIFKIPILVVQIGLITFALIITTVIIGHFGNELKEYNIAKYARIKALNEEYNGYSETKADTYYEVGVFEENGLVIAIYAEYYKNIGNNYDDYKYYVDGLDDSSGEGLIYRFVGYDIENLGKESTSSMFTISCKNSTNKTSSQNKNFDGVYMMTYVPGYCEDDMINYVKISNGESTYEDSTAVYFNVVLDLDIDFVKENGINGLDGIQQWLVKHKINVYGLYYLYAAAVSCLSILYIRYKIKRW